MRRLLTGVIGLAMLVGFFSSPAAAQSFVHGFKSKSNLAGGTVVTISKSSGEFVEAASGGKTSLVYGVVVNQADAQVVITAEGQNVYVATSGVYPVLVSVENGPIEAGDYLAMSSTDGVAAKVSSEDNRVIGQATSAYDGSSDEVAKSDSGASVGLVSANISPGENPLRGESLIPVPIRSAAESIAGKNLSAIRLYGAFVVLLLALLMAAYVLWIGVRGGMIAIGRNPLSRHSIMQSLAVVVGIAVVIFVVGLLGVYLLLKL